MGWNCSICHPAYQLSHPQSWIPTNGGPTETDSPKGHGPLRPIRHHRLSWIPTKVGSDSPARPGRSAAGVWSHQQPISGLAEGKRDTQRMSPTSLESIYVFLIKNSWEHSSLPTPKNCESYWAGLRVADFLVLVLQTIICRMFCNFRCPNHTCINRLTP